MSRGYPDIRLSEQIRTLFHAGSLGGLTDGQLLDRYASRDGECAEMAFTALVERHGPMVLGVCRRLLSDSHLAEDAFQATFLVLARRAKSVRNRDSLGGWLHRVAHRIALRLRGSVERRNIRERPCAGEVAMKRSDKVEREELRSVIDEEIDRLGDAQRLPVVLCCLEGISHEEASQRLHWPLGTIKSRLARGRRRLQERLIRRGFAPTTAIAAAGTGLLVGVEAAAAVPPALIEATAKAAAALAAGGALNGVVPAALAVLVREESSAMIATNLKLAIAATLTAGISAAMIGFVIAAAPGRKPDAGPLAAGVAGNGDEPKVQAEAPRLAAKLSASGTVVDSNGKPISGARVILREWSEFRIRGMPQKQIEKIIKGAEINDILMESKTDEAGRFRFQDVPAPAFPAIDEAGKSVYPWDIVALARGEGAAWMQLTPEHQRNPITLKLGPEGILRGRCVEPGGKPVVGAKIKVVGISPLGKPDVYGNSPENNLILAWSTFPLGATTDRDGRFTVLGLPREKLASLAVIESRHEMVNAFAATTDLPQVDFVLPTTPATRMPVYTGEFTLTAKVADHVLTGQVIREADGKPAARAQIIHRGAVINADENGRFQIEGLVAGKVELHASANRSDTGAAPVAAQIEIPETPTETQHTLILPRGLVVTGRVLDGTTGAGVEKALVDFAPKPEPGQTRPLFGFSKETGRDGRFQLIVPPGRGTLVLRTIPLAFPQPERQYTGQAEDPKYSREVEGRGGQTLEVAEFKLSRGREVVLHVVDPDGRPLANAQIDIRDHNRLFNTTPGHSDAAGHYTVGGLAPDQSMVVDIIDAKQSFGATMEIPDAAAAGAKAKALEVRLLPLRSLSGRVLDEDGKPISGAVVRLYRNVMYPGQAGRSFGVPVETQNEIKEDGTYKFDHLIVGGTYNTQVEVTGYPNATSNHVAVKTGKAIRFEDFRLPAVDQEVKGIIVDPRGKPLAGVSVNLERSGRTNSLYAPTGGVWFQDTDEAGRFHLTALPRGPIRLMVYRNPAVAYSQIKGIKYADVTQGQAEVRIELPDANDRLRGIE